MAIESSGFPRRMALVGEERPHLPVALTLFAQGTRSYLLVSTVFGAIVAVGDWIALTIIGVPAAALWGLLAFVTNYVPNIGFVLGVVPPALLGLLAGGWGELIAIVVVYSLLNFVVQTLIQPRFVGDSVGLSMTVTFIALLFWGWVLGALGALLAIPLTLLVKALLVDVDPRGHWLDALLREEPRAPRTMRARRRMHARRAALASVRRLPPPAASGLLTPGRPDDRVRRPPERTVSRRSAGVSRNSGRGVARCRSCAAGAAARPAEEADMKGDRVEIVIDAGGSTRTYDIEATRAGRRVEVTHGRGAGRGDRDDARRDAGAHGPVHGRAGAGAGGAPGAAAGAGRRRGGAPVSVPRPDPGADPRRSGRCLRAGGGRVR